MHARQLIDSLDPSSAVASLDHWRDREREAIATIVAHLAVLERERIHLDMGYSSLFVYCTERLGYSPDCAMKRMRAARVALVMPEILDDLESGALTLSSVLVLAKHLDGSGEAQELALAARGRSKREVETLVAERHPDENSPRGMCRSRPVAPGLVKLEMVVSAELADAAKARGRGRAGRGTHQRAHRERPRGPAAKARDRERHDQPRLFARRGKEAGWARAANERPRRAARGASARRAGSCPGRRPRARRHGHG